MKSTTIQLAIGLPLLALVIVAVIGGALTSDIEQPTIVQEVAGTPVSQQVTANATPRPTRLVPTSRPIPIKKNLGDPFPPLTASEEEDVKVKAWEEDFSERETERLRMYVRAGKVVDELLLLIARIDSCHGSKSSSRENCYRIEGTGKYDLDAFRKYDEAFRDCNRYRGGRTCRTIEVLELNGQGKWTR